jgi:hypothetical protein
MTIRFFLQNVRRFAVQRLRSAAGYTIVSTLTTVVVGTIVLTGAWMTYIGYQAQWKVANADRMMDQYAAASMQEMTNLLSWSWGAQQVQGGRNFRWKFLIDDQVKERGPTSMRVWETNYYHRDQENFVFFSYDPNQGILFNGVPPHWARDAMGTNWYQWGGKPSAPTVRRIVDSRDRISVEAMSIDINDFRDAGFVPSPEDQARLQMVLKVELVMHYTSSNPTFFGLYHRGYVRERRYSTEIAMRNWDVEHNDFRDNQIKAATPTS